MSPAVRVLLIGIPGPTPFRRRKAAAYTHTHQLPQRRIKCEAGAFTYPNTPTPTGQVRPLPQQGHPEETWLPWPLRKPLRRRSSYACVNSKHRPHKSPSSVIC